MIGNGNLLRNTYRPRSDGDHLFKVKDLYAVLFRMIDPA